jgi:predicted subunit of tRNA(5-methylaminomethyl-2-thiouridylate) methyltransferase
MEVAVCFSGGKDSALAALVLEPFYEVTLVTGSFGVTDDHEHARERAAALDFPFETVALDREVATAAVERILADGYPRNGIQRVHEHCLETLTAGDWDAVADGTRRDDRVPSLDRSAARSLEDRHGVEYLAPLAGVGRAAVDDMVARRLDVETGPSEAIERADYEAELRALIARRRDDARVEEVFPDHTQSTVLGRSDRGR